ncbi:MAG: hypothetical protein HC927_00205 [Deltaproteobacteria bacterium]|nr:hypothetical protein [Deltaproteobacteria bacterium]
MNDVNKIPVTRLELLEEIAKLTRLITPFRQDIQSIASAHVVLSQACEAAVYDFDVRLKRIEALLLPPTEE